MHANSLCHILEQDTYLAAALEKVNGLESLVLQMAKQSTQCTVWRQQLWLLYLRLQLQETTYCSVCSKKTHTTVADVMQRCACMCIHTCTKCELSALGEQNQLGFAKPHCSSSSLAPRYA